MPPVSIKYNASVFLFDTKYFSRLAVFQSIDHAMDCASRLLRAVQHDISMPPYITHITQA